MAAATISIAAPPERVFAVLANPGAYADWVVGSDAIRDHDPDFPAPGSRFHHRVGVGPLKICDHTDVLAADPPHRLVLCAKARPLGTFRVTLTLRPQDGGTLVTLDERPGDLLSRLWVNPLTEPVGKLRNEESLRRLRRLAEGR